MLLYTRTFINFVFCTIPIRNLHIWQVHKLWKLHSSGSEHKTYGSLWLILMPSTVQSPPRTSPRLCRQTDSSCGGQPGSFFIMSLHNKPTVNKPLSSPLWPLWQIWRLYFYPVHEILLSKAGQATDLSSADIEMEPLRRYHFLRKKTNYMLSGWLYWIPLPWREQQIFLNKSNTSFTQI